MAALAEAETGSSRTFRLLGCVADEVTRETVSRTVSQLGWLQARVQIGGIDAAIGAIGAGAPPHILLVDIAGIADPAGAVAELARLCGTLIRLVAIGTVNDIGLYRQLTALGVADYLVKPISSKVLYGTLATALRVDTEPGRSDAPRPVRLFAFVGARGGVGTTTLAVASAWLLVQECKLRTALVDLDLHFGNIALSLDLEPGRGLREAFENPERIDSQLLATAMASDSGKLPILAGEEPLQEMLSFDESASTPLLAALGESYDCIVVDLPRSLDRLSRRVLAAADIAAVVTDLSLSALRDTHRLIDLTKSLGCRAKPLLIANQVGAVHRGEIGRAKFERGLGAPLDHVIPFDVKAAAAAAQAGKAFPAAASGSPAAIAMRRLVQLLSGRKTEPRGLFKRWFG